MALIKQIKLDNEIVLNYHRIVSLNKIVNKSNVIEIASYTSEGKRKEEKEALEEGIKRKEAVPMDILIYTDYIEKEYNENETIENAYGYLKTIDKFKGAEDA